MSDQTEYTTYLVLRRDPRRPAMGGGVERAVKEVEDSGVTIRGFYDVSGMRDDADLMVWMHGPDPQALQQAVRTIRRADLLAALLPSWIATGVHVQAEFSRSHAPAFMLGPVVHHPGAEQREPATDRRPWLHEPHGDDVEWLSPNHHS